MQVLVTGASGAIGSRLVRRLVACGHDVRALSRRGPQLPSSNVQCAKGDLLDGASLERAARGTECVIHLAAVTRTHREELYEQVNVSGTRRLLAASVSCGVGKFVFLSSRTACEEGGAYARSKLRAEHEVRSAGLPWVVLRPSEVYGAGENEAIAKIIRAVMTAPVVPMVGSGDALVAPVYVDDVTGACVQALLSEGATGKSYTLAGPQEMTLTELVSRIEKKLGKRKPRLHLPVSLVQGLALVAAYARSDVLVRDQVPRLFCAKSADISLARVDLAYNPRTLEQGLDDLLRNTKDE